MAVTYKRGIDSVTLTAVPGSTPYEQVNESGIVTQYESRDWLLDPTELILDGVTVLPAIGDEIRETVGSETHVYHVRQMDGGPHWRYTDEERTMLRIHTKHHSTE